MLEVTGLMTTASEWMKCSISACLACTGSESSKRFDFSEGTGAGGGVLLLESIEE